MKLRCIVTVPVTNLRREPILHSGRYEKDPLQESQLLFGETVLVNEQKNGWVYVESLQQEKFSPHMNSWGGYMGWIKQEDIIVAPLLPKMDLITHSPWSTIYLSSDARETPYLTVSCGTPLTSIGSDCHQQRIQISEEQVGVIDLCNISNKSLNRIQILERGVEFLGCPYLWGGLSAYQRDSSPLTGIDCSGLSHILYRTQGFSIPRDAHDQFLKAKKIEFNDLQPADLIFLSDRDNPNRISHVMLYMKEDEILEANATSNTVRIISGLEKLGRPLNQLHSGQILEKYRIFFGHVCTGY